GEAALAPREILLADGDLRLARRHVLAGGGARRDLLVAGDEVVELLGEVALVGDDLVLALAERLLLVVDRAAGPAGGDQLLLLGLERGAVGRHLLAGAHELVAARQDVALLFLELLDAARHLGGGLRLARLGVDGLGLTAHTEDANEDRRANPHRASILHELAPRFLLDKRLHLDIFHAFLHGGERWLASRSKTA